MKNYVEIFINAKKEKKMVYTLLKIKFKNEMT